MPRLCPCTGSVSAEPSEGGDLLVPLSPSPPPLSATCPSPADDVQKLAGLLDGEGRSATPEFFPKPACPFYEYKLGALSPYGDEARATLQYGAEHAGGLDGPGLTQHLVTYFKVSAGSS